MVGALEMGRAGRRLERVVQMTDIVDKLKLYARGKPIESVTGAADLLLAAAAEIERLRAENRYLRPPAGDERPDMSGTA